MVLMQETVSLEQSISERRLPTETTNVRVHLRPPFEIGPQYFRHFDSTFLDYSPDFQWHAVISPPAESGLREISALARYPELAATVARQGSVVLPRVERHRSPMGAWYEFILQGSYSLSEPCERSELGVFSRSVWLAGYAGAKHEKNGPDRPVMLLRDHSAAETVANTYGGLMFEPVAIQSLIHKL